MNKKFQLSLINCQLNRKGFTLIELIIVVAVLGVLATTLIMTLNPAEQYAKAVDAKRKGELSSVQKALEAYYQDHDGQYPLSDSEYRIQDASLGSLDWGNAWGTYMSVLPKDSAAGKKYAYYSDGSFYYLYASLDRKTDPDLCTGLINGECASLPNHNHTICGTNNTCDFGLSSPNVTP